MVSNRFRHHTLAIGFTVLSMGGATGAQAQAEIRIGSAAPVSGPSAHQGKDTENGARMAINGLNAKGVLIGGKKVACYGRIAYSSWFVVPGLIEFL